MPHRLRKVRKKRGSRTHGWGRVGQHRRTGSKGRRNPGRHKALWSYVSKYEPGYFSKVGFTSPRSVRRITRTINVGMLEGFASKILVQKKEDKSVIDLEALGYTKLLGSGKITVPFIIKVGSFSESAEEKVKAAGGQILAEKPKTGE
jgi:large subunit ribosomal protein L15